MLSEADENEVWIHLYGGEQDGWRGLVKLNTTAPKKFYIWHVSDETIIDQAKGKDRVVLQSKLATMAYERFDEVVVGDKIEYRYRRLATADKPVANPAI